MVFIWKVCEMSSLLKDSLVQCRGLFALFGVLLFGVVSCRDADIRAQLGDSLQPAGEEDQAIEPVVILTWDEYFAPEVIEAFEKESGIPVEFVTFENLDEMDALLRSRPADFDLLVASGGVVADLIELRMLQPIREEEIVGMENLDSRFLGLAFDPENTYSVPYMWGTTLIAYRSDKIEEPEKSWTSLWDLRYREHVLMVDDGFDVYAAALLADGKDLNSSVPEELENATNRLLNQADRLQAQFVDIFAIREKLLSGDCWISMTYSSDAAVLSEENENIAYFIPEEGAPMWLDSFVIPRESNNSANAHLFLSYLLRAEVAAANSNALWSASANESARDHLSKEILEDPTLYLSDEVLSRCQFDHQASSERQQRVNQGLKKVFDRVRENASAPTLSVLTWPNYVDRDVLSRFESVSQSKVKITEVENSEQLRQEMASHTTAYDVVIADEMTLERLLDLRVLAELRPERIPKMVEADNVPAAPFDPESRYSIPYLWGLTVLAGKKDRLEGVDPSWNLLWRKDLRVAIIDEPEDVVWISLLAAGIKPGEATAEEVDIAANQVISRFPEIKKHMMGGISALDALDAGEKDLVIAYNGDALSRALKNPDIRIIVPKEGAPIWIDSLAISRDAPQEDLAYQFIHFMSRPENSAASANGLSYASPIAGARELMDPELLAEPVLYPETEILDRCAFVRFPPELQKLVNQSVIKILRGDPGRSAGVVAVGGEMESEDPED